MAPLTHVPTEPSFGEVRVARDDQTFAQCELAVAPTGEIYVQTLKEVWKVGQGSERIASARMVFDASRGKVVVYATSIASDNEPIVLECAPTPGPGPLAQRSVD